MWGYWLVLLLAATEAIPIVGAFVPGASLIVLAGVAGASGVLGVGGLIWFATIGAVLGDGLSYYLGTKGKRLFRPGGRWLVTVVRGAPCGSAAASRRPDASLDRMRCSFFSNPSTRRSTSLSPKRPAGGRGARSSVFPRRSRRT
jgi:hypothetical protein